MTNSLLAFRLLDGHFKGKMDDENVSKGVHIIQNEPSRNKYNSFTTKIFLKVSYS